MEIVLHVKCPVFNVTIQILLCVHHAINHYFSYLMVNACNVRTIASHVKIKQLVLSAINLIIFSLMDIVCNVQSNV